MAGELSERQRVRELIQRAGVAMLTTIDDHGVLAGRPMLPLLLDNDPDVYFLTHQGSRKVTQISTKAHVALTIMSADRYFAVAGVAYASRDPDLIRRLWHPTYRAWFPEGREAGDATVLRLVVQRVDYWEPPRSRVLRLFQALKAVITRRPVETPMKSIDGL